MKTDSNRVQARMYLENLLLLMLFLAPLSSLAQAPGASPEINRPYEQPDYQTWVERFESEGREIYDRRLDILRATGVKPGMHVADIGAGTGLFTRLFASEVGPTGKVYAVDISRPFVQNILRTAREQGLANVEGVVNSQNDTKLPPASIDLAFLSDTYHHFEQPQPMLASIRRALRPNGTLVVIDFERIPGKSSAWVMSHVRAGKETVVREVEAAGFRLIKDHDAVLEENFFLVFRKL